MNAMPDIRSHAHADTLLNDYVMGTLSAADQDWLDDHMASCAICQIEVPLLLEATFTLPFALDDPPVAMSDDLWDRIALSIQHDLHEDRPAVDAHGAGRVDIPSIDPTSTWPDRVNDRPFIPLDLSESETGSSWKRSSKVTSMGTYKWLALAAAAVLILGLSAVLARNLLWPEEDAAPPQTIAMVDGDGNAIGSNVASLQYLPDNGTLLLEMNNLPVVPEGQIYQAWLIAGDVPVAIGTVDPAAGEFQHEVNLNEFDAFAITIEPGPDGSQLPTTTPVIVAPLETTT